MYLRRYEGRKNGKNHIYWALVESIRTVRGSRQRIVAYLGELKKSEGNGWAQFSRHLHVHQNDIERMSLVAGGQRGIRSELAVLDDRDLRAGSLQYVADEALV